jgi:hypothetical protein
MVRAAATRARPSGVRGPVLVPPCMRQRPFFIAGPLQGHPRRVLAPQRGAALGLPRRLPFRRGPLRGGFSGCMGFCGFAGPSAGFLAEVAEKGKAAKCAEGCGTGSRCKGFCLRAAAVGDFWSSSAATMGKAARVRAGSLLKSAVACRGTSYSADEPSRFCTRVSRCMGFCRATACGKGRRRAARSCAAVRSLVMIRSLLRPRFRAKRWIGSGQVGLIAVGWERGGRAPAQKIGVHLHASFFHLTGAASGTRWSWRCRSGWRL